MSIAKPINECTFHTEATVTIENKLLIITEHNTIDTPFFLLS